MKIMTFNINHFVDNYGSNKIEHQKFADYIKSVNPDVLGFNEVRACYNSRPGFPNQTAILSNLTDMPYCFFAKAIKDIPYGMLFFRRFVSRRYKISRFPILR